VPACLPACLARTPHSTRRDVTLNRYEVIVYTASLNKYADPLLDKLDTGRVIRHRLFRESCTQYQVSV